ncbi:MAG: glycosyltransferase [Oscillospiraceae bacterium]|nr:glycosyltransferase [Oscillospiraceae bacterium]
MDMKTEKRCIFHYPHPVEDKPGIGSALRPNKMRAAFENIGYRVDEVSGFGAQRKRAIARIKRNIRAGVQYDFVYSESVNVPTLLTEEDHIPRYPFLDFSFFGFCRKHSIPVGLFYRDMHWMFPVYREHVSRWKRMITLPLFRYDLRMYRKHVNLLYVASEPVRQIVPHSATKPLPPGGQAQFCAEKQQKQGVLRVFYVGNVMGVYDITDFCKAVSQTDNVYLTICTPKSSWEQMRAHYAPYMSDRICVVHRSSAELAPYYEQADVFCCCLQVSEYTRLAMPIKTFESIGYGVPVMISEGIAAGDLIEKENCGWVVQNTTEAYAALLARLRDDPAEVKEKTTNTVAAAPDHTWESRARQVVEDLLKLNGNEG